MLIVRQSGESQSYVIRTTLHLQGNRSKYRPAYLYPIYGFVWVHQNILPFVSECAQELKVDCMITAIMEMNVLAVVVGGCFHGMAAGNCIDRDTQS